MYVYTWVCSGHVAEQLETKHSDQETQVQIYLRLIYQKADFLIILACEDNPNTRHLEVPENKSMD